MSTVEAGAALDVHGIAVVRPAGGRPAGRTTAGRWVLQVFLDAIPGTEFRDLSCGTAVDGPEEGFALLTCYGWLLTEPWSVSTGGGFDAPIEMRLGADVKESLGIVMSLAADCLSDHLPRFLDRCRVLGPSALDRVLAHAEHLP